MLTKKECLELAKDLRKVAAMWETEPHHKMFKSGICMAVYELRYMEDRLSVINDPCTYQAVGEVLYAVQEGFGTYLNLRHFADDRATMCLFMAEWLETDGLVWDTGR